MMRQAKKRDVAGRDYCKRNRASSGREVVSGRGRRSSLEDRCARVAMVAEFGVELVVQAVELMQEDDQGDGLIRIPTSWLSDRRIGREVRLNYDARVKWASERLHSAEEKVTRWTR